MKTKKVKCKTCNKSFLAQEKEFKRGNAKFCSLSCSASRPRKPKIPNCNCDTCGVGFYRQPSKQKSKHGFIFCSRKCKESAQKLGGIKEIQPSHYGTGTGKCGYRKKAFASHENVCNRCGLDEVGILQVHHKDRNRNNNKVSNLEILCPNCHVREHRHFTGF